MYQIPFRQIHLDFHTSGLIPDVGSEFDPVEFVSTLKNAHVESINIFAKCHHGYAYYPSKVVPVHPALKFDLLGSMIEALHKEGIRCPLYVTVVWDEYASEQHPEWLQVDSSGTIVGRKPYGTNEEQERWYYLCVNTPYMDYVSAQVDELIQMYAPTFGVDGFWFDILKYSSDGCSCSHCRRDMVRLGMDPSNLEHRRDFAYRALRNAMKRLYDQVKSHLPEALVFFNGRQRIDTVEGRRLIEELPYMTHTEIESLASGEWGYNHFPLFVRYNQPLGKEIIGMTGRFHRSWADFGGYKNPAALEYECFSMIANAAKVCVGDQLHPRGRLEPVTYDLIRPVFASIKEKEPWCVGATPVKEIGVLAVTDGEYGNYLRPKLKTLEGASQMLIEDHRLFQVLDWEVDFSPYRLLICPDFLRFDPKLALKIRRYLKGGGAVLLTYQSGLSLEGDRFELDLGADMEGVSPFRASYLRFLPPLSRGIPDADYVVYHRALQVRPREADVLANLVHPYFDRNWNHFMSHAQTPPDKVSEFAGALKRGNLVYFAHPLFTLYKQFGNLCYKKALSNAIDLLLGNRIVETNLPSTAQVTVTEQSDRNRYILHILHYPRERRARIDIIEDVIPLYDIEVCLRLPAEGPVSVLQSAGETKGGKGVGQRSKSGTSNSPGPGTPKQVYLAPEGKQLPFTVEAPLTTSGPSPGNSAAGGMGTVSVRFRVPEVRGHRMVVVEY